MKTKTIRSERRWQRHQVGDCCMFRDRNSVQLPLQNVLPRPRAVLDPGLHEFYFVRKLRNQNVTSTRAQVALVLLLGVNRAEIPALIGISKGHFKRTAAELAKRWPKYFRPEATKAMEAVQDELSRLHRERWPDSRFSCPRDAAKLLARLVDLNLRHIPDSIKDQLDRAFKDVV